MGHGFRILSDYMTIELLSHCHAHFHMKVLIPLDFFLDKASTATTIKTKSFHHNI